MQYTHIVPARFCSRPNRFIAEVELPDGSRERVHVKNTGRCRELLVPGARIYLEGAAHPARKTRFDLVAVEKGSRLINMDAQAPRPHSQIAPSLRMDANTRRYQGRWFHSSSVYSWLWAIMVSISSSSSSTAGM